MTDHSVFDDLVENKPSDTIDEKLTIAPSNLKTLDYDEDTVPLIDDSTVSTAMCTVSDEKSAGNASLLSVDVFEVDDDGIRFNYRGSKVVPRNECPVTICTVNTIGAARSRRLFRVLLDSGCLCHVDQTISLARRHCSQGTVGNKIRQDLRRTNVGHGSGDYARHTSPRIR